MLPGVSAACSKSDRRPRWGCQSRASRGRLELDWQAAAQQLAEADPAGWAIGWGAWPAGMRDNQWQSARFRRAA